MIDKTLHRKQWSTKHHTGNNDLQNITQKTTIYKTSHRKQRCFLCDVLSIIVFCVIFCRSLFSVWCFVDRCFLCKNKRSSNKNPIKTGGVLMRSERSSSFCTACDTRRVTHVTNPVISHEGGKDRIVITTNFKFY
jgi:hypothetical protein